jgi:hypothetical protein
MINKGLFAQLSMIILALSIGNFYVWPTFGNIEKLQDEIAVYQEERQNVDSVNADLAALVARLESIPAEDQRKLLTYLPDHIDPIGVARLLQAISEDAGLQVINIAYDELAGELVNAAEQQSITDYPVPYTFNFSVQGTYAQLKAMLAALESNEYPLEVHMLTVGVAEGSFLNIEGTIVTYSHLIPNDSPIVTN